MKLGKAEGTESFSRNDIARAARLHPNDLSFGDVLAKVEEFAGLSKSKQGKVYYYTLTEEIPPTTTNLRVEPSDSSGTIEKSVPQLTQRVQPTANGEETDIFKQSPSSIARVFAQINISPQSLTIKEFNQNLQKAGYKPFNELGIAATGMGRVKDGQLTLTLEEISTLFKFREQGIEFTTDVANKYKAFVDARKSVSAEKNTLSPNQSNPSLSRYEQLHQKHHPREPQQIQRKTFDHQTNGSHCVEGNENGKKK